MRLSLLVTLVLLSASSLLNAQKGADPTQRYFRLICLVHLKGSGQAGDARVPEFVVEGTEVARAAQAQGGLAPRAEQQGARTPPPMTSRPGILAWSMLKSDDETMAIIQVVAADRKAFDSILADKRAEIRVFEIGKDKPETIQNELRKYRRDFELQNFQVVVQ